MSTDPRFAGPTPFARLAMAHAASMCGDACLTVSLAGSLFFTAPTDAARGSILLYLALTMAPFAVIAPIVGPALDRSRGGRRMMVFISCAGRAVLCLVMAGNLDNYLLYPLAFGVLVLAKAQSIAKSSLVPGLVRDEGELVEANSRLALISVLAAAIGGLPAAGVAALLGSEYSLVLASIVFVVGSLLAIKIPRAEAVAAPETSLEREELHAPSIILAGSAMGVLRGVVGFLTFFVAFALKDSVFSLGVALAAAGVGGFGGTVIAPFIRRFTREELLLAGSLIVPAVVALFAARNDSTSGIVITAFAVALGAAAGRLGFDSIVQRDAPDAIRGRAFARFETRFQLVWVFGGLLGIIPMSRQLGLIILASSAAFAGVSYVLGMRRAQQTVDARRRRAERTRAGLLSAARSGVRRVFNRGAGPVGSAPAETHAETPGPRASDRG
jgi:MFS family permease